MGRVGRHTERVRGCWSHNTHYHGELIRRLPPQVGRALDVGCGDGSFARLLALRAREVVAIDADPRGVERARLHAGRPANVHWECADFLTYDAEEGSFDLVSALAVLHHLPFDEAIAKMRRLLKPGGRLLVLGVWPSTATAIDVLISGAAVIVNLGMQATLGATRMDSPAREPDMPLREVRRRVRAVLPDAVVRRRLLWRYVLEWSKPAD
jgi:2-polyprenyl-3-methyl-5-hydroxy-6-metoxy-1,4-benzoquinol methylase